MGRRLPSLNALRAFEAAARHLSFTAAADELYVTQGAISRRIKTLETHLGLSLFRRLPRALELTPEAHLYFPVLREAFDQIERATLRLLSGNPDRILTISMLPTLAMRWFIPRLPDFNARHPTIEIRMVTSIRPVDFHGELDIAIRVGAPQRARAEADGARIDLVMTEDWSRVVAEYLMPDLIVPVCSPKLIDGAGPLEPRQLKRYTLLHTSTRPHAWGDWLRAMGENDGDLSDEPAYGHFFMAIQAALEGRGIACVPKILIADDLAAGRLVAPVDHAVESSGAYHLLYREHQRQQHKIKVFREWILAQAGAT